MELQEKKYLVDSFFVIQKLLKVKKAPKVVRITSTHYYGYHKGNDVEKYVEYADRFEIHIWKDTEGRMTMIEHAPKNPTLDERINWHLGHVRNCFCRPLAGKILAEIKKRGLKVLKLMSANNLFLFIQNKILDLGYGKFD